MQLAALRHRSESEDCFILDENRVRVRFHTAKDDVKEIIEEYLKNTTVEGYYTLESIYQLLKDKEVTIPIIDLIYEIAVKGKNPELLLKFLVYKS